MKSRAGMKNKSLTDFHLFILLSFFFFFCIAICHVNIISPQWNLLDISYIALGVMLNSMTHWHLVLVGVPSCVGRGQGYQTCVLVCVGWPAAGVTCCPALII